MGMDSKTLGEMTSEDIFKAIHDRQITALRFHYQMADLFDFLGLMGFREMHEYQYLAESIEHRRLCRYYINHYNRLLVGEHPQEPEVIPTEWVQYTRFDVTPQVRKQAIEKAFNEYRIWESKTREAYSGYSKALMDLDCVADSLKINEYVKDVDRELKYLDQLFLKLKAISFDAVGVMDMQEELHDHYREKIKSIGVDIC